MKTYLVTWEIDIEANSHREAAAKALEIQHRLDSTANQFYVQEHSTKERVSVDFLEDYTGWMDAEEAKSIKEGDRLEILVGGCGGVCQDDGGEEELEYEAGEIVKVSYVDYLARQGLAITIVAPNGVVNVYDALDYGGRYPFKRI